MKKAIYSIICVLVIGSILSFIPLHRVDAASVKTNINRLGGADRFEVAVNISKEGWNKSNTVIISSYGAYADALTATPLAYKYDAPILLTHSDKLTLKTKNEIIRLNAKQAFIIGGPKSVSPQVEKDLKEIGITKIKRFGGNDRFEVSKNISKEFPNSETIIVAYGHNFPDALSIAPYAAENGYPILLTRTERLPEVVEEVAYGQNVKNSIIVGGPLSVGEQVFNNLKNKGKNPIRINGKDRYEVSANIAKQFYSTDQVFIATGLNFADALTGSVLAAKRGAPILLSYPHYPIPVIQNAIFEGSMFDITVLGGPVSVPEGTLKSLVSFRKAIVKNDGSLEIINQNYDLMDSIPLNKDNEVVVFGNQIVKMRSGIVYGQPSLGNSVVKVYDSPTATNHITYVAPNTEMNYISSDEKRVKVQVSDFIGYVDQKDVNMKPWNAVTNRSSYFILNGDLFHKVDGVNTVIGKAPAFMKEGVTYYSWDGYKFSLSNGQSVGQYKQYFQYLPIRTKTNYTAEELLNYINSNQEILAWEKTKGRKSPLRNEALIKKIMDVQEEYGINALFILAAAIHESAWGVSDIAYSKNNLFGITAYDDDPNNTAHGFKSYEDSVIAFVNEYMVKGYTNPSSWKYNGGFPGHKGMGINRQYASDPNWGSRVAGHMYKIDKALGKKDYDSYQLMVTTQKFRVRSAANNITASVLYEYPNAGIAVALPKTDYKVIGSEYSGSTIWYKIISEVSGNYGYIHSSGLSSLN